MHGIKPMPSPSRTAVFLEAAPYHLVDDIRATADYYRDVLGFSIAPFFGEPPSFVIVKRNTTRLMFRQVADDQRPAVRPNGAKMHGALDVYIWVSDVDALAEELRASGAEIVDPPCDSDRYRREMLVRDLNGYLLCFGRVVGWPG
jgi:catechol 2,3-dioxygenase-like lactoylglutathione lyase family enzyme